MKNRIALESADLGGHGRTFRCHTRLSFSRDSRLCYCRSLEAEHRNETQPRSILRQQKNDPVQPLIYDVFSNLKQLQKGDGTTIVTASEVATGNLRRKLVMGLICTLHRVIFACVVFCAVLCGHLFFFHALFEERASKLCQNDTHFFFLCAS